MAGAKLQLKFTLIRTTGLTPPSHGKLLGFGDLQLHTQTLWPSLWRHLQPGALPELVQAVGTVVSNGSSSRMFFPFLL
jgi:hypothetical protein